MTQEEKQLLLKDLCSRVPYGVQCLLRWAFINETTGGEEVIAEEADTIKSINFHTQEVEADYYGEWVGVEDIRPYLRPLSSMTEEEKEKLKEEHKKDEKVYAEVLERIANGDESARGTAIPHFAADWCNAHHFDYRGLIPMGLALEAKEGMYKEE